MQMRQAPTLSRKSTRLSTPPTISDFWESLPIVKRKAGERILPIKTQARSATILPNFVGLKFQIHNGKNYLDITITEDMVGHKLGEFAPYVFHSLTRLSHRDDEMEPILTRCH